LAGPKAFVSWSSGKDSAFALWEAQRLGLEIAGVMTTINEVHDRVAMHGVRSALLDRQIAALGLPAIKVPLPSPCANDVYETRMATAYGRLKAEGVCHVVFGDLLLEDIRAYREAKLAETGMTGLFPLWKQDTARLAEQMIDEGLVAHLVCVDPRHLARDFAGRKFDRELLRDLPPGIDPCGEKGEFHTVVSAGPMFSSSIPVVVGDIVERDGFVFADVIPE